MQRLQVREFPPRPTRKALAWAAALIAATRLVLVAIGVAALSYLPLNPDLTLRLRDGGDALDMWYRWDAGFYTSIATYGYDWWNTRAPSADLAFMPIYPGLVRLVSGLTAEGCALSPYWSTCTTIGGLIVSNLAFLAAGLLLFDLAWRVMGRAGAWRALVLLCASPIGIFLSGIYTESLFLLLTIGVFWLLERDRFGWAIGVAAIAALTRSVGFALTPALLWWAWTRDTGARRVWRLAAATVPTIVFAGYILFSGTIAGDPLAYFASYELTWQRTAGTPIDAFTAYFQGDPVSLFGWRLSWLDLGMTLGYLVLALALVRLRGIWRVWGIFALVGLAIPISSGTLVGMPRFGAVLFPFYLLLARWTPRGWMLAGAVTISAGLAILFAVRFVTGAWIA